MSEPLQSGHARKRRKATSSEDVAARAGVSRSTVSRVFTPGARVAEETRRRVLRAAREVGYRADAPVPERAARQTVGLVMGALDNPFYNTVMTAFLSRLQRRDVQTLCYVAEDLETAEDCVSALLDNRVDAIIAAALGARSSAIAACADAGVPLILFNRAVEADGVSSVQTDNVAGGRTVADFLFRAGHRKFSFINGLDGSSTNRDRLRGFTEHLAACGATAPMQEYGEYTYEGGREAAKRLMCAAEPPDAIFCANDIMAFGVLDCLRGDLGLRTPQDVSVIGFDDVPMAAWPSFGLTTVRQRRTMMIEATMDRLEAHLAGAGDAARRIVIEGRLIVRSSARLPRP
jgi:DNA-binding LacI/PurR family transcriptional regulator